MSVYNNTPRLLVEFPEGARDARWRAMSVFGIDHIEAYEVESSDGLRRKGLFLPPIGADLEVLKHFVSGLLGLPSVTVLYPTHKHGSYKGVRYSTGDYSPSQYLGVFRQLLEEDYGSYDDEYRFTTGPAQGKLFGFVVEGYGGSHLNYSYAIQSAYESI